ncbi:hypothetical protein F2Q70_00015251 [Brassica cretica]|uniref:PGG domain-containing protein n=1 Tax=Brassica cretica TaxID=69181 RepID=A0A8S9I2P1_BRACR|nr:hypothetical protein F2Q70_00015251 [Brassica cretica]
MLFRLIYRRRSCLILHIAPSIPGVKKEGFSPLHAALEGRFWEMIKSFAGLKVEIERLIFHVAAVRGKTIVMREIGSSCVDCIEDETVQGQTSLHLAVLQQEVGAVIAIVELITETDRVDVLYKKDEQGNTALHLATWRKKSPAKLAIGNSMRNSSKPELKEGETLAPLMSRASLVKHFTFKKYRDSPSEARSALLVVLHWSPQPRFRPV